LHIQRLKTAAIHQETFKRKEYEKLTKPKKTTTADEAEEDNDGRRQNETVS
jgi:hypothetical protein